MSGPLHIFRRHQKALLAVFGVLIMITFTVGGVITSYQNRNPGYTGTSEPVLTWKQGTVTEQQMVSERNAHNLTVRFLDALIARAIENGGTPKGPGLQIDQQQGRVIEPGIPRSFAEEDLVRTMLLAQKATEMGMKVSEEAIFQFLDALSDDVVPHSEFGEILSGSTGGQFVKLQLFDRLEKELLAQNMRMLASSGLFSISPEMAWDYFNRTNRRVEIEALPMAVADFKDEVAGQPTEAQIKELYEDGKNRYANPYSAEPGFKQRQKIAFEYLKADFEDFLTKEMAAVTDEQIQAYYEENKSDFKAIELPSAEDAMTPPEDDAQPAVDDQPASEAPVDETSEAPADETSDETSEPAAPMPEDSDAADAEADTATEPTDSEDADAASEPKMDLQAPANETPDPAADDAVDAKPEDAQGAEGAAETPEDTDQSRSEMLTPFVAPTFVSLNLQDGEVTEEPDAGQARQTAQDGDTTEPQTEPAAQGDDAPAEQPAPSEEPPAETADDSATGSATDASGEAEQEVKYKPLEEVADEIRRNLARPPAQEAMSEALAGARSKIEKYYKERATWQALSPDNPDLPKPVTPDTQALAAEYGLVAGDTPLVDVVTVSDYELGKAYRFDFSQGQMGRISFAQIAFSSGLPLYKTDQIRSFEVDVEFLYWKIEEKEPFVPELKDIRDEVVDFWKTREAFELAQADAHRLAEKVDSDKPLKDSLGEEEASKVIESSEFSWLTRGAMPSGYGAPSLSSVDGIESPGEEFMESVFDLQVGQVGVAVNAPRTFVYVVRVVSESPDEDLRRQQFLAGGMTNDTFFIAMVERQKIMNQWFEDLEKEMKVTWYRQPDENPTY